VLSVTGSLSGASQVVDEGWRLGSRGLLHRFGPRVLHLGWDGGTVNWGDGTTDQSTVYMPDPHTGIGSVSAQHFYADDGEYHPLVTVRERTGARQPERRRLRYQRARRSRPERTPQSMKAASTRLGRLRRSGCRHLDGNGRLRRWRGCPASHVEPGQDIQPEPHLRRQRTYM